MNIELVQFEKRNDSRGNLSFFEVDESRFFPIKRVYWLYDVPKFSSRGAHAHKNLRQIMLCVKGSLQIKLDDGYSKRDITLNDPTVGLVVEKMIWRDITDFSSDAVLIVFASERYSEDDYFRNYEDFLSASKVP